MELCRCEVYHRAVEHFKGHTIGTLKPFYERREGLESYSIKWVNNKANHNDMRLEKPVLQGTAPPEEEEIDICRSNLKHEMERRTKPEPEIEPKWIPFHYEISLRAYIMEQ
ncbi:unnamed protein product [Acanthoscelides obtectus]|uniref:Uncharacterized protein n=1 Tax=Acanthoscelides obtectus TaxID=200917 RepID=A0A9P0P2J1_ACAOB|nr:unnamed protein product [Acanthoscelides obtectus]CAK1655357.1 hypothetical protein AOBTE_LOCUS19153 [Acanthoscelides obtectus]